MISRIDAHDGGGPGSPPPSRERRRRGVTLDGDMRACLALVALAGAVLAAGALFTAGAFAAFSVALGAALAEANLWLLARIVAALIAAADASDAADAGDPAATARSSGWGWPIVGVLKILALFAIVWLLMRYHVVSPLALLVGFGALPLGIVLHAVVRAPSSKTRKK